ALFDDATAAKRAIAADDVVLAAPARVARFTAVRLEVSEERARELERLPGVRVWPWTPPTPHDERSGQIVAGAIDSGGQLTTPGYMAFLESRGLTSEPPVTIDVTDSGFDRGSTTDVPPELLDGSGASRVVYARDFTFDNDPHDISGHGTLNASIAAGLAMSGETDPSGYSYGLGVAPEARIGSSRIFRNNGVFDVRAFYYTITAPAWRDGARVSSNSWGSPANIYTPDSIEYDALVRDADPDTPGNQQMTVVFSAGNAGPGGHIETPATAKNVISVGAAEGLRAGTDGCEVGPSAADSAFDIAFFSAGGPVLDGRVKPDLVAPGTHIAGTKSRAEGFNGSGVCAGGFPGDSRRFTWSSGTSHAAPAVSGAAALLVSYLENARGNVPSPALVKAWLLNSTRYLEGAGAYDDLPSPRQGWGLLDLGRAFDGAPRFVVDQTDVFDSAGQQREYVCAAADAARPVRVTLAWTDAPGDPGTAPELNDLDLEVEAGGVLYRGNHFARDVSTPGGAADSRNNVEGVWLPAGLGPMRVRVRARELGGDGIPGNGSPRDQDFALVVYNAVEQPAPLPRVAEAVVAGDGGGAILPGGSGSLVLTVENSGNAASVAGTVQVTGAPGVVAEGAVAMPALAPGARATLAAVRIDLDGTVPCGAPLGLVVRGGGLDAPVDAVAGDAMESVLFEDDVEGPPRWTFQTENRGATWAPTTERSRSGEHSWHASGSTVSGDSWIVSEPIAIPADAISAAFSFWHTFSFERGFDGGVVEISDGGPFVDIGTLATEGGYLVNISNLYGNTLGTRPAWTGGSLGAFVPVSVDLTPFAGRTVRLRLRIGADAREGSGGWYVDDFRVTALRPACSAAGVRPVVTSASYRNGKLKLKGTGFAADARVTVNGRDVLVPVTYRADKGVLKVKAAADVLKVSTAAANVVVVTVGGRASRVFGF
ncbi:MAG TPA: S8 family serine peptidase, partial [Blastocatellia bacterium]|nr:S8 family serine peptidase [Blastocatellia bacterium]